MPWKLIKKGELRHDDSHGSEILSGANLLEIRLNYCAEKYALICNKDEMMYYSRKFTEYANTIGARLKETVERQPKEEETQMKLDKKNRVDAAIYGILRVHKYSDVDYDFYNNFTENGIDSIRPVDAQNVHKWVGLIDDMLKADETSGGKAHEEYRSESSSRSSSDGMLEVDESSGGKAQEYRSESSDNSAEIVKEATVQTPVQVAVDVPVATTRVPTIPTVYTSITVLPKSPELPTPELII